jgi:hypothetical protein
VHISNYNVHQSASDCFGYPSYTVATAAAAAAATYCCRKRASDIMDAHPRMVASAPTVEDIVTLLEDKAVHLKDFPVVSHISLFLNSF